MNMRVENLMKTEVGHIYADEMLNEAARIMWEMDCGTLPVLDRESRVTGMITDRDICMAAYTQGKPISQISVSSAMSKDVYSCTKEDDVESALGIMRLHRIRRLPILDENDFLVGIISLNDIALAYEENRSSRQKPVKAQAVADTLAAICGHSRAVSV